MHPVTAGYASGMTTRNPAKLISASFVDTPSTSWLSALSVSAVDEPSITDGTLIYAVSSADAVPTSAGLSAAEVAAAGFAGKASETATFARAEGPNIALVGLGDVAQLSGDDLRDIAASAARATAKSAQLAFVLTAHGGLAPTEAARVIAEGLVLARYRYTQLQSDPKDVTLATVQIGIIGVPASELASAVAHAEFGVRAACVTRDLANHPPGHLTATNLADAAVVLGREFGFDVEVFDKAQLIELGCGGLLGVNQGSVEEPRMVKLSYRGGGRHLGFVGKGIMYDSGGINLKPSDGMHLLMKMDMAGAAALLGMFTAVKDSGVQANLTAWLMCTDNMPSSTSYKMGDVLTARNGKTVEVRNTDAEGRLAMMDGLSLAVEEKVDGVIDIATLTGSAMMALGELTAALVGNNRDMIERVEAAAKVTGEQVWEMPLERKYRKQLDSKIADLGNVGGKYAGMTTAALFLEEFVAGTPWAHLDIAGTMNTDSDDSWRSAGATGYGARLLLEVAKAF